MEATGRDSPKVAELTIRKIRPARPGSIWIILHRSAIVQSGSLALSRTRKTTVGGDGMFGLAAICFKSSTFCRRDNSLFDIGMMYQARQCRSVTAGSALRCHSSTRTRGPELSQEPG